MDLRHIPYFKRVAELEHITKAAQDLYVSQAHLSRIIASIEEEVGVKLFDRDGRGITLNDSGKIFYGYVIKLLNLYGEALHRTRESYNTGQFQLSVATNTGAYMPELLTKLSKLSPNMKVRQNSAPRKSIIAMLRNGSIDFAITAPPINEIGLTSEELFDETPVVIYPEQHWLKDCDCVSLEDLKDELFVGVMRGYGARDTVDALYREEDFAPNFVVETGDSNSVLQYVSKGIGIALCAKSLILQDATYRHRYTELTEKVPCMLGLTWSDDHTFSDFGTLFFDETKKHFGTLGDIAKQEEA